jgi:uncharacterized protein YkwD
MHRAVRSGLLAAALLITPSALTSGVVAPAIASGVTSVAVDAAAAARAISDYRKSGGLPPVKSESRLNRIAATHSQKMAALDRLDHVLPGEGSFRQRVEGGGYAAAVASENIGAGYDTLAEVIAAWKASPGHNVNMLRPDVTEIGIALYRTPRGAYRTYWTLILASPRPPEPVSNIPFAAGGNSGGITIGPFTFFGP